MPCKECEIKDAQIAERDLRIAELEEKLKRPNAGRAKLENPSPATLAKRAQRAKQREGR